jgi:hypothetical protein
VTELLKQRLAVGAKPASFVLQRGAQAETSQRNLLMMDTLDHLGSTIRPNCIFAFPQVAVSYEKFHASYVIYDQYRDHSKR